ncbi:MAG TPA: 2Fe-2S iron-sulfur cluster-binding protein, partial [Alphaproteobacteria bacterium]|nr:2Fe-2S iron-sulfur cluster-binding protein [Alphaproteobacteria bacterium]
PGFLMLAMGLKASGRVLTREEIRIEVSGVLCRCTGYDGIVRAVEDYLGAGEGEDAPALEVAG